jgi:ABC-type proline/glycine betaine transport system substrate-binding protein
LFSLAALCLWFVVANVEDASAKSRDPIRIGVGPQTRQQIMAHIAGQALQRAGFKVEFVEMTGASPVALIAAGDAHFDPEFRVETARAAYTQALAEEKISSLGGLAGNGFDEPEQKIIWAGMNRKWPNAEKMLKTMIFSADELGALARSVDDDGQARDAVVSSWMKQNKSVWKRWISASTNWMKP